MPSTSPKPNLGKSTALTKAQATVARLAALVPTLVTEFSPVTVYQPNIQQTLLDTTSDTGGIGTPGLTDMAAFYGVWTAPDLLGNGQEYYAQVECFGAGGGAGGGNASLGGGGGGGGAYSCEPAYPITPGSTYAYVVGFPGTGGLNTPTNPGPFNQPGSAGTSGGVTVFDTAGLGLAGGVVANGGAGGDQTSVGVGGSGGVISSNTVSFAGGGGGTNASSNGSDDPQILAETSGCFVGGTLSATIIPAWYVLNDGPDSTYEFNDSTGNGSTAKVTTNSVEIRAGTTPSQVPAYFAAADAPTFPNATAAGVATWFKRVNNNTSAGKITTPSFAFSGSNTTVSCWIQCDPSGFWGNTASGSYAVISANTQFYSGNSMKGYALFIVNDGTAASPKWNLYSAVGNGTSRTIAHFNITSLTVPGQWIYVVTTYQSGTLNLYVNGTLQGTTASSGYTSVPGGRFSTVIGLDPNSTANWFFGYISNIWYANDTLTTAGIASAQGLVSPTGGAGGGASGGPSAAGGNGVTSLLSAAGAGGAQVIQPAALASTTTPGTGGFAGAAAGSGNPSPLTPGGGECGGGGGGGGDMAANSPNITTLIVPFVSAATYNGIDASQNPGTPYNVNQQNNPASGVNSVLYAGGLPTDASTGSKNSLLLLPPGLAAHLNSGRWLIQQVFLTFTNAYPTNQQESLLEVFWTADTTLPQTYTGADYNGIVGALPIPAGAGTLTYDITEAGLAVYAEPGLQNGFASAFLIGTTNDPTFDAYNAPTGPDFYASIYGPGAMDQFGNSQQPYLTLVLAKTSTYQQGSNASGGGIVVSYINQEDLPVAMVQPFAGADTAGNAYAESFTGQITPWSPVSIAAGVPYSLEGWHSVSLPAGITGTIRCKVLAEMKLAVIDFNCTLTSTLTSGAAYVGGSLPSSDYYPAAQRQFSLSVNQTLSTTVSSASPRVNIPVSGGITLDMPAFNTSGLACLVHGTVVYPLN